MQGSGEVRVVVTWPDERPVDWTEWEAIIRTVTQSWPASGEISIERQGNGWRIASVVTEVDPPQPSRDNQRRHRITEALRARGKPAGLGGA